MFLRKKLEEVDWHRRVLDKMDELNVDFITLCRIAHVNQFGTDPDQSRTYITWKQDGIVPNFIIAWLALQ